MEYENIAVDSPDGVRCHAWLILQPEEVRKTAPTILYLHGNAGNIGMRLPLLHALFTKLAVNVMALDYRGYGRSKGTPSEAGLTLDATTALAYLGTRADIDAEKVVIFGRSLGGAVGASVAATQSAKLAGLVLENTFISVAALAVKLFFALKFLKPLLPLLMTSKWDTKAAVRLVGGARAWWSERGGGQRREQRMTFPSFQTCLTFISHIPFHTSPSSSHSSVTNATAHHAIVAATSNNRRPCRQARAQSTQQRWRRR
jgi:pimeloyl-ACP methyl ester carboxylesterase